MKNLRGYFAMLIGVCLIENYVQCQYQYNNGNVNYYQNRGVVGRSSPVENPPPSPYGYNDENKNTQVPNNYYTVGSQQPQPFSNQQQQLTQYQNRQQNSQYQQQSSQPSYNQQTYPAHQPNQRPQSTQYQFQQQQNQPLSNRQSIPAPSPAQSYNTQFSSVDYPNDQGLSNKKVSNPATVTSPVHNYVQHQPPYKVVNSHQHGANRFGPDEPSSTNQIIENKFSFAGQSSGSDYKVHYELRGAYTNNTEEKKDQAVSKVLPGTESFALEFFEIISKKQDKNFMLSPFSVWLLLVLLSEGSSGKTFDQIQQKLHLPEEESLRTAYIRIEEILSRNQDSVKLDLFNALITDKNRPASNSYEDIVEGIYAADLFPVDFKDTRTTYVTINNYTNIKTKGQIKEIVSEADLQMAQMILLSGIHFEGNWKLPFNESYTRREPFYDTNNVRIGDVDMMYEKAAFPYSAVAELEAHAVELPYGQNNQLSMIALLPRKGATIPYVLEKLKRFGIANLCKELDKSIQPDEDNDAEVYLPRFTTETQETLVETLVQMGIGDLFNEKANLTKIVPNNSIYVSSLIQKTKIVVNEKGTIASATSASVLTNKSTPPRFYANRPFAYLIVQRTTNLIVFIGSYVNPNDN